jgi:serine protease Do
VLQSPRLFGIETKRNASACLVIDVSGLTGIDSEGRELIEVWRLEGARIVVNSPAAKERMESMIDYGWLRIRTAVFGLLLIAAASGAQQPSSTAGGARHNLQVMSGEMERLSSAVAPKVVQIATQGLAISGNDKQPAGVLVTEHGKGSGFFVSADGYLLTNAHVIANAVRITVTVQASTGSADGERTRDYTARVAGVDGDNDLALLKIDAQSLPFFDLAQGARPRQGQLVLAYGNPFGLSQSATLGLVSAVERQLDPDDPRAFIQTDAPLNPGNSGGPLVDLDGHLLGVNTMILSSSGGSEGIGFAIPLDVARRSCLALRDKGAIERPMLGVQPRSLTPALIAGLHLATREGVLVEDVAPDGPGARAGLQAGDVISNLAGKPIRNIRELFRLEYELPPDQAMNVTVIRGGQANTLHITPSAPPNVRAAFPFPNTNAKDNMVFHLGVYATTMTPALASTLTVVRSLSGVLVIARAGEGMSGQNPLQPGDIIHAVNGADVDSLMALREKLDGISDGAPVVLQVERQGVLSYMTPIGSDDAKTVPTDSRFNGSADHRSAYPGKPIGSQTGVPRY